MRTSLSSRSRLLGLGAGLVLSLSLGILLCLRFSHRTSAEQEHREQATPVHAGEGHEEGVVLLTSEARQTAGIRVVAAGPGVVERYIQTPGIVRANQNHAASIIPTTSGVVTSVKVNVGERVRRGAVLAIMRSPELAQAQADQQRARRELELARQAHERALKLAEAGAFSQPPTEAAAQALSEAARAVEEAQAQVEDRTAKLAVAQRNLQRARDAIRLGSVGLESIEDAQRAYDEAVEARTAAEAEVARAQSELGRQQTLIEHGLTTQQALEQARRDVATAQAALARAEAQAEITAAKLARAKELVAQDIPTGRQVDAAQQNLVEAEQALQAARARLREAQRQHDIARQRLEREQHIYDEDLRTARELARTELEVRRAESALKAAVDTVRILSQGHAGEGGTISIVAPVSGTIISRNVKVGEAVGNTSVLFEIANIRTVFVEASLYEQDIPVVRRGQRMRISVQAYPDTEFTAVVDSIDPVLDADAKKVVVRALVDNPKARLMPGMFAEVRVQVGAIEVPLAVPATCLEVENDDEYVFVEVERNRFERRAVVVGRRGRDYAEILEGIEPGEKVVVEGSFFLKSELVKGTFAAGHTH